MIFITMLALAAAQSAPIAPLGRWTVDYRPDMCVASRPFGTEATPTLFGLEPSVSMDSAGAMLLIVSPNSRGSGVRRGEATVVLSSGARKTLDYVSWTLKASTDQRAYEVTVDADFMSKLDQSTELSMNFGKESFALATGPFSKVLGAMKTCTDNLLHSWGVDPAARAVPANNPGGWFTDDDYPAAARRRGVSGRVAALVTAGPDGRVKACRIVSSSKDPDLDETTCELAKRRGRYKPGASDSFAVLGIRWVL
jgi:TonB family protein